MQVEVLSLGQTGDLGVRSKGQISLNFSYKVNFKDVYTKPRNFVCLLTNKRYKTYCTELHSVACDGGAGGQRIKHGDL